MAQFENLHKLVPRHSEDVLHIHKTLGILCMVHYLVRFVLLVVTGSMWFDSSWPTLFWIFIHAGLSGTSLVFKIPLKRNPVSPMIWPEFRLHSILFAYRSLVVMLLMWAFQNMPVSPLLYWMRGAVVLSTIYLADRTTWYYKRIEAVGKSDSTMRGMPMPDSWSPGTVACVNMYYSVSQVLATLGTLTAGSMEVHFLILFPIQLAAFLMTCVRKGIITSTAWHVLYAGALGLNYLYWTRGVHLLSVVVVLIVCLARFVWRVNKYLLWTGVVILLRGLN
jgi:hypothetical protein